MHYPAFIRIVADFFEDYLNEVAIAIERGHLQIQGPYSYPTNLRVGESPTHFIAELLGFTRLHPGQRYRLTRPKVAEKYPNTTSFYLPGFDIDDKQEALFSVRSDHFCFRNLTLSTTYDQTVFLKKVNFDLQPSQLIGVNAKIPIAILPLSDYTVLQNVDFVRTDALRVLFRTVLTALSVRKPASERSLLPELNRIRDQWRSDPAMPWVFGLTQGYDATSESFARALAGLADLDIDEPILDRLIQSHAEHFAAALGYRKALSQVRLRWIEREQDDPDEESKPDYLLERADGCFDILDLKRAALRYDSIVVGKKGRLRFNSYVSELVAQLAGYEKYFGNPNRREWALAQYGVRIANPRLIGVVGNYDNFDIRRVKLALQPYRDNIVILSYQDLIDLLKKRSASV